MFCVHILELLVSFKQAIPCLHLGPGPANSAAGSGMEKQQLHPIVPDTRPCCAPAVKNMVYIVLTLHFVFLLRFCVFYTCVHVHRRMCICVYVHAHAREDLRPVLGVLPQVPSALIFKTGSLFCGVLLFF